MTRGDFLVAVNECVQLEASAILERFHCSDALDMISGGKRLRALLLYSLVEDTGEKTVRVAAAIELLHASTLVHDDIIDNASTRRGYPTISDKYGADTALLVGTAVLMRAMELARQSLNAKLQAAFHRLYVDISAAQNDELLWRGKMRSEPEYREVSHGKTGLLFEFAVLASGADDAYARIVSHIAYAFQIVDDIDDVMLWRGAADAHHSKLAEYDIELGNITLPAILALEHGGVSRGDFGGVGSVESLSDSDWNYGIGQSRERVATVVAEQRRSLANIADDARKARFITWAEPMMRQLEAESSSIDDLRI